MPGDLLFGCWFRWLDHLDRGAQQFVSLWQPILSVDHKLHHIRQEVPVEDGGMCMVDGLILPSGYRTVS